MKSFNTVEYNIKSNKIKNSKSIHIVMLSDLHNREHGAYNNLLIKMIKKLNPHVVLVGGDMITASEKNMEVPLKLLMELSNSFPIFYANGNHEQRAVLLRKGYTIVYAKYKNSLKANGVVFLEDEKVKMTIEGNRIDLYGYDLPISFYKKFCYKTIQKKEIENSIGLPDKSPFSILLAHNPMHFKAYADWGADLTLSGHLHGGIIRLPIIGGVITPQALPFPKYDRGLYNIDNHKLIVSAGLGEHTIKIRINNPAQLVVINLN